MQSTPQSSDLALDEESMLMVMEMAGWRYEKDKHDYMPLLTSPTGTTYVVAYIRHENSITTAFKDFLRYIK